MGGNDQKRDTPEAMQPETAESGTALPSSRGPSLVEEVDAAWFHEAQCPIQLLQTAVLAGQPTLTLDQDFAYCDIGCGSATTLITLAACYPQARFIGIDPDPARIEAGLLAAAEAGLDNLQLIATDLAALPVDGDTGDPSPGFHFPDFAFIAIHSLYDRVATPVRITLRAFAAARLKPAGLLYVDYDTVPANTPLRTIRYLLRAFAANHSGSAEERAAAGLADLRALAEEKIPVFAEEPAYLATLAALEQQGVGRATTDWLTRPYRPQWVGDVIADMAAEGLEFVGPTTPCEIDPATGLPVSLPPALQDFFLTIEDHRRFESLKAVLLLEHRRHDVFRRPGGPGYGLGPRLFALCPRTPSSRAVTPVPIFAQAAAPPPEILPPAIPSPEIPPPAIPGPEKDSRPAQMDNRVGDDTGDDTGSDTTTGSDPASGEVDDETNGESLTAFLMECLDRGPLSFDALADHLTDIPEADLRDRLETLLARGWVTLLARTPPAVPKDDENLALRRFRLSPGNRRAFLRGLEQGGPIIAASPVLGTGIPVPPLQALVLLAGEEVEGPDRPAWCLDRIRRMGLSLEGLLSRKSRANLEEVIDQATRAFLEQGFLAYHFLGLLLPMSDPGSDQNPAAGGRADGRNPRATT